MKHTSLLGLLAALLAVLSNPALAQLKGMVKIDGSSTVYPITEAVAEEFGKNHKDVKVTVGISGTGGGFKKFAAGETDISDASRPIKDSEEKAAAEKGIGFIELPIAFDALTVVVNKENTWCDTMTVAELKKLWEPAAQGKITRWSQIRQGWPDQPIKLFGPGADSGTFDYFTEAICGKEDASRGDFVASEDDNVLVQGVARDKYALGYFGFAYYEENTAKLKAVKIDNGKGGVAPSPATVANNTYQPLSRPIFIYVSTKAMNRPEVKAFVDFYLDNAARLVKAVRYVPLTQTIYGLVKERWAKRKTGSVFRSGSEVGVTLQDLLSKEK